MSHSVNLCAIFVTVLFFSAVRCSDNSHLPDIVFPEDQGTFTMLGGSDAAFCAAGHEDGSLGWAPKPFACLPRRQHGYEEFFARSNQAMLAMLGCVFKRPPSGAGDGALPCGAAQGSQLGDEFATQSSGATLPSLGDRNDKGKSDAIPSHAHPASEGPFGPPQPRKMTTEDVLAEQQKNINELLSRKRKAVKQSVEESSMVGNTLHSEAVDKSVEISPVVHTLHSEGEEIIFQWSPILE